MNKGLILKHEGEVGPWKEEYAAPHFVFIEETGKVYMSMGAERRAGSIPHVLVGVSCDLQSTVQCQFFQDVVDVAFYGIG